MSRLRMLCTMLLFAPAAPVAADALKPEDAIAYRQSIYRVLYWNYQPIADQVRGKRTFDPADVKKRAARVVAMSLMLDDAYAPGSDKGAQTEALPAIWQNPEDFRLKLTDFQREAQALQAAADTADAAKVKDQLAKTTATCKACHDKYRAD